MIKTIFWDFDGVILDSMKIKGDGFLELFKAFDADKLKILEKYHYENGGVSRFDKIRYFYNNILKKSISEEDVLKLSHEFGKIISKNLNNKNNLIKDSLNFIKANYEKYDFHIVSGAEHYELNTLCKDFDLLKYFKTINGSPTKKDVLVKNIIGKYGYKADEAALIGDAMTDYNAAVKNGIIFYGFNNLCLEKLGNYIHSFKGLKI